MTIKQIIFSFLISVVTFILIITLVYIHWQRYLQVNQYNSVYSIHDGFDNHFIAALINSQDKDFAFLLYLNIASITVYIGYLYMLCFTGIQQDIEKVIRAMLPNIMRNGILFISLAYVLGINMEQNYLSYSVRFYSLLLLIFIHYISAEAAQKLINDQQGHQIKPRIFLFLGILINMFIDYQLCTKIDITIFTNSPNNILGWQVMPYICLYNIILAFMSVVDTYINYLIHFYNVFVHPLSYTLGTQQKSIPNYIQLDHELRTEIYVRFFVLILKIVFMSVFALQTYYFLEIFSLTSFTLIYDIYRNVKQLQKYYQLIKLESYINNKVIEGVDSVGDNTCTICFWEIKENCVKLNCGHLFHIYCLKQWVLRNNRKTCLQCKKSIYSQPQQKQNKLKINAETRLAIRRVIRKGYNQKKQEAFLQQKQKIQSSKKQTPQNLNIYKQQVFQKPIFQINMVKIDNITIASNQLKKKNKHKKRDPFGSFPFGLPKEAVYQRTKGDMNKRNVILERNNVILKVLEMPPSKQLLLIPQL